MFLFGYKRYNSNGYKNRLFLFKQRVAIIEIELTAVEVRNKKGKILERPRLVCILVFSQF